MVANHQSCCETRAVRGKDGHLRLLAGTCPLLKSKAMKAYISPRSDPLSSNTVSLRGGVGGGVSVQSDSTEHGQVLIRIAETEKVTRLGIGFFLCQALYIRDRSSLHASEIKVRFRE